MHYVSIPSEGINLYTRPFYEQSDYIENTKNDFSGDDFVSVYDHVWDSEGEACRTMRRVATCLFVFPLLYEGLHVLAARNFFLPSSAPSKKRIEQIRKKREKIVFDGSWKYKRISVLVNGFKVDGAIFGKSETLQNRKWILVANGNNSRYESILCDDECDIKDLSTKIGYNVLVFNYPGVGSSQGFPGKQAMINAYRAMLSFLENKLKAEKIIGFGYSTGGCIINHVFSVFAPRQVELLIKDRSPVSLGKVASETVPYIGEGIVKALNWNVCSINLSITPIPEIVIQTAEISGLLTKIEQIVAHDNKIPRNATLAAAYLSTNTKEPMLLSAHKKAPILLGVTEKHSENLTSSTVDFLVSNIKDFLPTYKNK